VAFISVNTWNRKKIAIKTATASSAYNLEASDEVYTINKGTGIRYFHEFRNTLEDNGTGFRYHDHSQ
jgi:hypothetical protein